jgi:uncharacterized protein (TIGR02246 family)
MRRADQVGEAMKIRSIVAGIVIVSLPALVVGCSNDNEPQASETDDCVLASDSDLDALFVQWNDSLLTGDASMVAANYRADAVLLPTLTTAVANTPEQITEYFVGLLQANPDARIEESTKKSYCNVATDVGLWVINANGEDVYARYSFVYEYEDGEWLIAHHHSSVDPTPSE